MTGTLLVSRDDDAALHVRIDGPADAPWVVFSNSVLTDLRVWDRQVAALAERFRVLRYDQRGHGGSSLPEGPMSFAGYGADLIAVLDAAGIGRCAFVGLSMGVPTGLAAYRMAPERFDGFVAVDGAARSAPGRAAFWTERRDTARADGMGAIADGTVSRWMPGAPEDDPALQALAAMIAGTPVEGFASATHALAEYDYGDVVRLLDCAFAGIAGSEDGAMPDTIRTQFAEVPGARFFEIDGAGHLPNLQKPRQFNEALLSFLDDIASRPNKEHP